MPRCRVVAEAPNEDQQQLQPAVASSGGEAGATTEPMVSVEPDLEDASMAAAVQFPAAAPATPDAAAAKAELAPERAGSSADVDIPSAADESSTEQPDSSDKDGDSADVAAADDTSKGMTEANGAVAEATEAVKDMGLDQKDQSS